MMAAPELGRDAGGTASSGARVDYLN